MERLPVLPLGQLVVYPHVVLPLYGDPPEGPVMEAKPDDLYPVGTLGLVVRMLKLMDGTMRVMIQGVDRATLRGATPEATYLTSEFETLVTTGAEDPRIEALKRNVVAQFGRVIDLAPYLADELHEVLEGISDPGKLADFVAANLDLALPAKAELLALAEIRPRLERLAELLAEELEVLEVGSQIQEKVRAKLDEHQREYVLREQLRVIRQELGEEATDDDVQDLATKLDGAGVSTWCGPTSRRSPRFRGSACRPTTTTSRRRARSSIAITTISWRSRIAFSSISPFAR